MFHLQIKKSITVGVVGLPNVGKSSLINSLRRCHVVNVGATPGLTRSMQEVQLDKNVKLLDCPGVVMARSGEIDASIALRNCKRIEKLDDPDGPVKEILKLCPAETLVSIYKIPNFDSADVFVQAIVTLKKGAQLLKCGRRGKPKFCPFRLSTDASSLIWFSSSGERVLKLASVSRIIPGQRTAVFQRYLRPEKDYLSFSLIYNNGKRSLDLVL